MSKSISKLYCIIVSVWTANRGNFLYPCWSCTRLDVSVYQLFSWPFKNVGLVLSSVTIPTFDSDKVSFLLWLALLWPYFCSGLTDPKTCSRGFFSAYRSGYLFFLQLALLASAILEHVWQRYNRKAHVHHVFSCKGFISSCDLQDSASLRLRCISAM